MKKLFIILSFIGSLLLISCNNNNLTSNTSNNPITSSNTSTTSTNNSSTTQEEKDDFFTIYSLEMHGTYGDSNLIKYNDFEILIDGGTNSDASSVQDILNQHVNDGILELLVVSHPDSDHIDGLEHLSTYESIDKINLVVQNGDTRGNEDFTNLINQYYPDANMLNILDVIGTDYQNIQVDEYFSINFLNQGGYFSSGGNKNNKSICLNINYKNTTLFMAGDLEEAGCNGFMQLNKNLFDDKERYVIFKILHHGSRGSNMDNFLSYLDPDFAFVNAGMHTSSPNNTPNFNSHPYLDAMIRVGKYTSDVYYTGINGDLTITCDGYNATAKGVGRTNDYYYSNGDGTYLLANKEEEKDISFYASKWYIEAIKYKGAPNYLNVEI